MWISKKKYDKMEEALMLSVKIVKINERLDAENKRLRAELALCKLREMSKQSVYKPTVIEPAEMYDRLVDNPIVNKDGEWVVGE